MREEHYLCVSAYHHLFPPQFVINLSTVCSVRQSRHNEKFGAQGRFSTGEFEIDNPKKYFIFIEPNIPEHSSEKWMLQNLSFHINSKLTDQTDSVRNAFNPPPNTIYAKFACKNN